MSEQNSWQQFTLATTFSLVVASGLAWQPAIGASGQIVHDADHYILKAQNSEKWAADDKVVDQKLAEFRKKNSGKAPNILIS